MQHLNNAGLGILPPAHFKTEILLVVCIALCIKVS